MDPAAFVTELAGGAEPTSAETADVTAGCSSPVAAWACLENSSRRKKIPAATTASCAARRATRHTSSCDIDSSHP
jgi:hypothetical protein